jgi:GNAT superfamily N-acetyltransferase
MIRFIMDADFNQWLPLWDGYNRFYGRFDATALPLEITQATWRRFLDPNEPMYALVAEEQGRLVGLAHYLFHPSTILLQPTCYLQDLFTAEHSRRSGIGESLIRAVYEQAERAHVTRVYWHTHESNQRARQVYDRVADHLGAIVYRKDL